MSALFDFRSFLTVLLLSICSCTYVKLRAPQVCVMHGRPEAAQAGVSKRSARKKWSASPSHRFPHARAPAHATPADGPLPHRAQRNALEVRAVR